MIEQVPTKPAARRDFLPRPGFATRLHLSIAIPAAILAFLNFLAVSAFAQGLSQNKDTATPDAFHAKAAEHTARTDGSVAAPVEQPESAYSQAWSTPRSDVELPPAVMAPTTSSSGLVIAPTFDASILNNPNSAAIQSMINQAIAIYQSLFSDPITVNILFRYSNTLPNGASMGTALAHSNFVVYDIPWNTYVSALTSDAKTGNDATANASLPGSPLSANVVPSSAGGRAIGLATSPSMFADSTVAPGGPYDGIVTLNSSQPFLFTRPPSGSKFDALRATEHEIDEVLGLGSRLQDGSSDLRPQDLFSWAAPGTRNVSSTGSRYFSINSGNTNIVAFSQNADGDFGDWLSGTCPQANPYVQNAFGCKGQFSDVTATSPEGINLDVIGYDNLAGAFVISTSSVPSSGGSTSGGGTFPAGTSHTVTATATAGYSFTSWTENGSVVSTSASYTFTVNSNRSLVAVFSSPCPAVITQSSSQTITALNSVSCNTGSPTFYHYDTSYWRAFNVAGVNGSQQYNVTSVSFGIDNANDGAGQGQPVTVRLYTNNGGSFPGGSRTQIAATSITVMDQSQTILTVPLTATVPAGTSELVMEVFTPSGVAAGNSFGIGSNTAAQSGPSYASSATCGNPTPTDTAAIGRPNMHLVFNIQGNCNSGPSAQALNIATRLPVELADNAMIGGFIISGNDAKTVLLRGIGPSLANAGLSNVLDDPVLELHGSNGALILQNDDWRDTQEAQIQNTGLQPSVDREAAIMATLQPGGYTGILTGKNQTTGVGLVEFYDLSQAANSQLRNLSTRGLVQSANNVMIGGFILGANNGTTRVAIRGIGPSLSQSGLSNVLANPTLELHDVNGTILVANDNWQDDQASASALSANNLALPNSLESGIFTTLVPGSYTAILAGKDGGTGIGLVEVYNLQ
jgi:Divergent InlB B-repeat domain